MLSYNEQLDLYGKDRKLSTGVVDGYVEKAKVYLVALSPEELADAVRVGNGRQEVHKNSKKTKPWNGEGEVSGNHILGAIGEKAVRKAFGLLESPMLLPFGGDGGTDIVLPSGKTVSIKMKRKCYKDNWFAHQKPDTLTNDYGVLCCPAAFNQDMKAEEISVLLIIGYITREEYQRKKITIKVPHGDAEGVKESMIEPFSSLLAIEKPTV